MSGPKNLRCRNFNDEGVGTCDSGEYCRFVHPGPRWADARPYNRNSFGFDHIPKTYFEGGGGGGGGGRGRPGGGGGGGKGSNLRRCRHYEADGTPIKGGCFNHPKGECRFTHPDQPGWDTAASSTDSFSRPKNSFGPGTSSNSLPSGPSRKGSTQSFGRASVDATADTGWGSGFGTTDTHQSPEPITPTLGWGQSSGNEPQQSAEETSGSGGWGSGWGGGDTNHGWGAGETTTASSGWGETTTASSGWGGGETSGGGWGNGGGWGSSVEGTSSGGGGWGSSGGGGWGSSSKKNDTAATTKPIAQEKTIDANPPAPASSDTAWGQTSTTWGSPTVTRDASANAWGSTDNAWGSSTWGSSNETVQGEPTGGAGPDKGKGKEKDSSVQSGGWSSRRETSNSENTTSLASSGGGGWGGGGGGGWGNSTPSIPATANITQDSTPATVRLDAAPAAMDVDEGEPNFEGKAIMTALEKAVHKRRNKRKRSHEDIRLSPRYYRHMLAPQRTAGSGVDGDGDAVMGGTTNQPAREDSLEAGEIDEVPPTTNYDMDVLTREPKTSREKTAFAKHLLHIFTEAAVAEDRSRRAEKRYEDYKKSQEARMYNHPGHDARLVLVGKLQALRTASNEESERLARIMVDLESLPSHNLFDVVAYNEHNHLTKEVEAEEKRKAAVEEVVKRWNEKHELVDRNLIAIQARIDELAKEKLAREVHRDLPPPEDKNKMAVEEAETAHRANMERVALVEGSIQTITLAESAPYRDGPVQTLEESLLVMNDQDLQLREFAEGIADLIKQVPTIRDETAAIRTGNEERKLAEEAREQSMKALDQRLATSSAQLETLNEWVTGLVVGLQQQVTMENVKTAIRPALREQTRVVIQDVHEYVERGLTVMRELTRQEQAQLEAQIYPRLVGTQRLFEAVGCYLRSVNAELASVSDRDSDGNERM